MSIDFSQAWSALQAGTPHNANIGPVPSLAKAHRYLLVGVGWEQVTPNTNQNSQIAADGQTPARAGHSTANVSGADLFVFEEADVAAMSGDVVLTVTSGAYGGGSGNNVGWAYRWISSDYPLVANAQGYANQPSGTIWTVNNPSPAAADYLVMVAALQISSITFGALSAGYTERIDASPGGMRVGIADAVNRGAESPTWTVASATDIKGIVVGFVEQVPAGPTITSVSTDDVVTATETNVVIAGSGFGASRGSGKVELVEGTTLSEVSNYDSWTDTSIQVDLALGGVRYGARKLRVTTNGGQVSEKDITINPPSGTTVVNLGSLRSLVFDAKNKPSRRYDSPTDVASGAQERHTVTGGTGIVTVDEDGRVKADDTVLQESWGWNSGDGTGWHDYLWDWRGFLPVKTGSPPATLTLPRNVASASYNYAQFFNDEDESVGLTYSATGLPTGMSVNSSTGARIGTPSVAATYNSIIVAATDSDGNQTSLDAHTIIIDDPPVAPLKVADIENEPYPVNVPILTKNCAAAFTGGTTYSINNDPPAPGLEFDESTGEITGTPTTVGNYAGLIVTAINSAGSTPSNTFAIVVTSLTPPPPTFSGFIQDFSRRISEGSVEYEVSGFFTDVAEFVLDVETPTGITFNKNTGVFLINLNQLVEWAGTVSAINTNGSATSNSFAIRVGIARFVPSITPRRTRRTPYL